MCGYVHESATSSINQKRPLDPPGLELQMGVNHLMSMLGNKLGSSERVGPVNKGDEPSSQPN